MNKCFTYALGLLAWGNIFTLECLQLINEEIVVALILEVEVTLSGSHQWW